MTIRKEIQDAALDAATKNKANMKMFRITLAILWCLLSLLSKKEDMPPKKDKVAVQVEVDSFVPQEYE